MTKMTVAEFRRQVQDRRGARRRGAPRYPDELVAFAVGHARAACTAGRSLNAAAIDLGLSSMTLGAWVSRGAESGGTRLREVVVRESPAGNVSIPRVVEVTTASGHIIRGLSVVEVAALLRALP